MKRETKSARGDVGGWRVGFVLGERAGWPKLAKTEGVGFAGEKGVFAMWCRCEGGVISLLSRE